MHAATAADNNYHHDNGTADNNKLNHDNGTADDNNDNHDNYRTPRIYYHDLPPELNDYHYHYDTAGNRHDHYHPCGYDNDGINDNHKHDYPTTLGAAHYDK